MTLLERFNNGTLEWTDAKKIRRALAIAQAVEEAAIASDSTVEFIMRRADELLTSSPDRK